MREERPTRAFSIIMAAIGGVEFDEMFSEFLKATERLKKSKVPGQSMIA